MHVYSSVARPGTELESKWALGRVQKCNVSSKVLDAVVIRCNATDADPGAYLSIFLELE